MEASVAIVTTMSSYDHQCLCKPISCVWSEVLSACVAQQGAEPNVLEGHVPEFMGGAVPGLNRKTLPLVGFRCAAVEEKTCRMEPCSEADFKAPGHFTEKLPGFSEGRIGIVDGESFNCWSQNGMRAPWLSVAERNQFMGIYSQHLRK